MSEIAPTSQLDYIERTVDVVAAYVSNNSIPTAELPALIVSVHEALNAIASGSVAPSAETVEKPTSAQVRKSIRPDGLISFIDGKSYKTLKRHLTKHGLDPHSYRERYGLPADYPTTAANYSAQRSALAKSLGLGQPGRGGATADEGEPEVEEAPSAPARSRRKAAATAAVKDRAGRKTVEAA
ncbi:MucR family transcriptional regulator [Methylobacterium sp. NEAU 140]|uniref:MucR family transcriptional regulator n=1 Tax=Methylobacterium sp. NEAU 140 TaxID=3064945 RepID=UPI002733E1A4|nr:MucR family transcriptional regulator [Methylobacterium sp. NEAU 140]MDP4021637.1 MucR family transcriptional regulator [Methylobacterium sp. NEAU 140]